MLETPETQGRLIAHHIAMRMREAYDTEAMMNESKKPGSGVHTVADYQAQIAKQMNIRGAKPPS